MKTIIGTAAAGLALAAVAFLVPNASAETGVGRLTGGTTSLNISRTVKHVSGQVSARFYYRLVEKEGNPAKINAIPASTYIGMNMDAGSAKEVSASCEIPLSSLRFTKVGNYALTLEEYQSSDAANYPLDTANKYDLLFQVTNVLNDNNEPTGDLQVQLANQLYSYKDDAKVPFSAVFEADANYTYISLENKVTGAAADADKYFKYKIDIDGVLNGTVLTVSGQDETVTYGGEQISTSDSYRAGDDDLYVYLKHGQTATIGSYSDGTRSVSANEIPLGASYTVEKVDTDDGYASTIDGSSDSMSAKTVVATSAEDFSEKNTTLAVNSKDATVNTGVFAVVWPFALAAVLGATGFVAFWRLSKRF